MYEQRTMIQIFSFESTIHNSFQLASAMPHLPYMYMCYVLFVFDNNNYNCCDVLFEYYCVRPFIANDNKSINSFLDIFHCFLLGTLGTIEPIEISYSYQQQSKIMH